MIKIKNTLKIILIAFLILLCVIVIGLFVAYITGRDKRDYNTLPENSVIQFEGKQQSILEIANEYTPKMYLQPSTSTPPLKWIWYEVVPHKKVLTINYYFNWENEINPNKTIHNYYSIFRAAYYGYPLYDIEYFQVNINTQSGKIEKLRFETSLSDNYFQNIVEHFIVEVTFNAQLNSFVEKRSTINGTILFDNKPVELISDNNHIHIGVQTWNHLSRLIDKEIKTEYSELQNANLKYLSDKYYSNYKFVRKSQGDYKSKENKIASAFALLAILLFVSFPTYLIRKKKRKKKRSNESSN